MRSRAHDEDGAALILALVFITLVGVAAMVLASLGFSSQKAAVVYVDEGKVTNALDSGIQAAIENARVLTPFGCANVELPEVNKRHVGVTCVSDPVDPSAVPDPQLRARLTFTARTPPCPAPSDAMLVATVAFSTIGGTPDGARIARTTAWKRIPPTPC